MRITAFYETELPQEETWEQDITDFGFIFAQEFDVILDSIHHKGRVWSVIGELLPPSLMVSGYWYLSSLWGGKGNATLSGLVLPYWSKSEEGGGELRVITLPEPQLTLRATLEGTGMVSATIWDLKMLFQEIPAPAYTPESARQAVRRAIRQTGLAVPMP